jgi:hypothetical protein
VNNAGQVLGVGFNAAGTQASLGTIPLPFPLGWDGINAFALNNAGQVAGQGYNGFNLQAFVATTSGSTAIPLPTGATTASVTYGSINDQGAVVGSSSVGGWMWDAADGTVLLNALVPVGWNVNNATQHQRQRPDPSPGFLHGRRLPVCRADPDRL